MLLFFIFSFVSSLALLLTLFDIYSDMSHVLLYAVNQIRAYDHSLFEGNLLTCENVISPRYIYDNLFGILMHLTSGEWGNVALMMIYLGAVLQAIAIATIGYRMDRKYQIFISAIFTSVMLFYSDRIASFDLIVNPCSSICVSLGFSLLSLSFLIGKNKNYNVAWIFVTCAAVFHIHEGLYCFFVVLIVALADSLSQKKLLIRENSVAIVTIITLLIVAIPNMLTDSTELSSIDFVRIYAYIKHPHHLVPSRSSIICSLFINISLFAFSILVYTVINDYGNRKRCFYEGGMLIAMQIIAMIVMDVFTKIKPSITVVTLMIPKLSKYVYFWFCVQAIEAVIVVRRRKSVASALLLLCFIRFSSSMPWFSLIFVSSLTLIIIGIEHALLRNSETVSQKRYSDVVCAFSIVGLLLSALSVLFKNPSLAHVLKILPQLILIFMLIVSIKNSTSSKRCGFFYLLICVCCMVGLIFQRIAIRGGRFELPNQERVLKRNAGNEVFDLATMYRNKTDKNATFLDCTDEEGTMGMFFQQISQRNIYFAKGFIPSFKCKIGEWYRRYMQTRDLWNKTCDEIRAIMSAEGIPYVLVSKSDYLKLDTSSGFSVFIKSPNDTLRIYELKNYANHNTNDG